jgi:hypothetical protein
MPVPLLFCLNAPLLLLHNSRCLLLPQTLTSMTVSPDTKLVAAGFSDSMVRLYHLALLGRQRAKLGERAEKRAAGMLPQAAAKRSRSVVRRWLL